MFSCNGERFKNKNQYQQAKNRARRSKMDPKIDTFCQVDTRVLAILGVEKVVFWTFSELFWSWLGSVWALCLTLKGLLLGVFSAPKVDKLPRKSNISVKKWLILAVLRGHFWPFWGSKKSYSGLFQSYLGVV